MNKLICAFLALTLHHAVIAQQKPQCASASKNKPFEASEPFGYMILYCSDEDFIYLFKDGEYLQLSILDSIKSDVTCTHNGMKKLEIPLPPATLSENILKYTHYVSGVKFSLRSAHTGIDNVPEFTYYDLFLYHTSKGKLETKVTLATK